MEQKRKQEKFSTEKRVSEHIIGCSEGKISYIFEYNSNKGWIHRERENLTNEEVRAAFYALAKSKVEDFRTLYHLLRKNDLKYFKIAFMVLENIQNEYDFSTLPF